MTPRGGRALVLAIDPDSGGGFRLVAEGGGVPTSHHATQLGAEKEAHGRLAAHGFDGEVMIRDREGKIVQVKRWSPLSPPDWNAEGG